MVSSLPRLFIIFIIIFSLTVALVPSNVFAVCDCYCGSNLEQRNVADQGACVNICDQSGTVAECKPVQGNGTNTGSSNKLTNPLGNRDIPTIIGDGIRIFLGIVGSIALAMFIYGGFMWLIAGGNTERVKKGREILTWATIGLLVTFASYAFLTFIFNLIKGS